MQLLPLSTKDLSRICCSCGKPCSFNISVFWATMFGRLTFHIKARHTSTSGPSGWISLSVNGRDAVTKRQRQHVSSMQRILYSGIPKIGAVASSRRVQTTWQSWLVILTFLLLLYPHLDKFLPFKKCANYVHSFCITMCKIYVLNRVLAWTSCSIYCAWTKYSILYVLVQHIGAVLNLHKFDFVRHVWMDEFSRWSSRVALFLVFPPLFSWALEGP